MPPLRSCVLAPACRRRRPQLAPSGGVWPEIGPWSATCSKACGWAAARDCKPGLKARQRFDTGLGAEWVEGSSSEPWPGPPTWRGRPSGDAHPRSAESTKVVQKRVGHGKILAGWREPPGGERPWVASAAPRPQGGLPRTGRHDACPGAGPSVPDFPFSVLSPYRITTPR